MIGTIVSLEVQAQVARYAAQLWDRTRYVRNWVSAPSIAIAGSYNTTNVGDLSIGMALKLTIESTMGVTSSLFGLTHTKFDRSQLVVWGGGDSLHDNVSMKKLAYLLKLAENPLVLAGVGVPGFVSSQGRAMLDQLLDRVQFITVRDTSSYQKLVDAVPHRKLSNVEVTADLAFLFKQLHPTDHIAVNKGYVGISAKEIELPAAERTWSKLKDGWTDSDLDTLCHNSIHSVRRYVKYFQKHGMTPIFIPFDAEDLLLFRSSFLDLKIKCAPLFRDPRKLLELVASMEYMVCTRYHSLVFAIITQTPMLVISYADKTDSLANMVPNLIKIDRNSLFEFIEPNFAVAKHDLKILSENLFTRSQQNMTYLKRAWNELT